MRITSLNVQQDVYGVSQNVYGGANPQDLDITGTSNGLSPIDPLTGTLYDPSAGSHMTNQVVDPTPLLPDPLGVTDLVYGPDTVEPMMAAAFAGPGVLETYTWDAANRLIGHVNPAGDQTEYRMTAITIGYSWE